MTFEEILPILKKGGKAKLCHWRLSHCEIMDGMICMVKDETYKYPMKISHHCILSDNWEIVDDNYQEKAKIKRRKINNTYTSAYLGDDN